MARSADNGFLQRLRDTLFTLSESDDPIERRIAHDLSRAFNINIGARSLCTYLLRVTTEVTTDAKLDGTSAQELIKVNVYNGADTSVEVLSVDIV